MVGLSPEEGFHVRDIVEWIGRGEALETNLAPSIALCVDPASVSRFKPWLEDRGNNAEFQLSLEHFNDSLTKNVFLPLENAWRTVILDQILAQYDEQAKVTYLDYVENEQYFDFLDERRQNTQGNGHHELKAKQSLVTTHGTIERTVEGCIRNRKDLLTLWEERESTAKGLRSIFSAMQREMELVLGWGWPDESFRTIMVESLRPFLKLKQALHEVPLSSEEMVFYERLVLKRELALQIQTEIENQLQFFPIDYVLIASPKLHLELMKNRIRRRIAKATPEELERYARRATRYDLDSLMRELLPSMLLTSDQAFFQGISDITLPTLHSLSEYREWFDLVGPRRFHDHFPRATHDIYLRPRILQQTAWREFVRTCLEELMKRSNEIRDKSLKRKLAKLVEGSSINASVNYIAELEERDRRYPKTEVLLARLDSRYPAFAVLVRRTMVGSYLPDGSETRLWTRETIASTLNERIRGLMRRTRWKTKLKGWDFGKSLLYNLIALRSSLSQTEEEQIVAKGPVLELAKELHDIPLLPEEREFLSETEGLVRKLGRRPEVARGVQAWLRRAQQRRTHTEPA